MERGPMIAIWHGPSLIRRHSANKDFQLVNQPSFTQQTMPILCSKSNNSGKPTQKSKQKPSPMKKFNPTLTTLALLLVAVLEAQADLTHRYSFNDPTTSTNAIDSVGGATGNLMGGASYPGNGTVALDGLSGYVQ